MYQGEINSLTPAEIGHAAAYEAFKGWLHENPAYDVLDTERQRAILIGLAVAECKSLNAELNTPCAYLRFSDETFAIPSIQGRG